MKYLLANAEILASVSFEETARMLENVIDGVIFEPEETGRFEEVPAFVASDAKSGMEFILFGIPEGEVCDAYVLKCTAETELPIFEFEKKVPKFISKVISEKEENARGYLDFSFELVKALSDNGIPCLN